MHDDIAAVINNSQRFAFVAGDCIEHMAAMPDKSVDLVFGSPPYELARLYLEGGKNPGIARKTEDWVAWMVKVFAEAQRISRGLVAMVVEGQTKNYRYSAGPLLLAADLHRAGFNLRKPPIFQRVGIPGSGGPDWLRNDYEFIICTTPPGKLPWSDNTACGHPPKWAPGGEMSYRNTEGTRRNQWGHSGTGDNADRKVDGERGDAKRPSHKFMSMTSRGADGERKIAGGRRITSGHVNGDTPNDDTYDPPALANPGNVIKCLVGGGVMGNALCHENEAPFPEQLAAFFVQSFCPPDGITLDPFSGSGTTACVAVRHNRRAIGIDLRQSQVDLGLKRIAMETPLLF